MSHTTFFLTDTGWVYGHENEWQNAELLGHISELMVEQSPLGEAVRLWWTVHRQPEDLSMLPTRPAVCCR